MQRDAAGDGPPHQLPDAPGTEPAAPPGVDPTRHGSPPPSASFDQAEAGEGDARLADSAAPSLRDFPDVISPAPPFDEGEAGEGDMRLGGSQDAALSGGDTTRQPPRPATLLLTLLIGTIALATSGAAPATPETDPPTLATPEAMARQTSTADRGFAPTPAAPAPAPATKPVAGGAVDFVKDVKPLLESRCVQCHGPDKASNEYRIDTRDLAFEGGEKSDQTSTDPIVPGDARGSLIYQFIATQNPDRRMPPKGKAEPFTPAQVELLRRWIDARADWPEKVELKAPPRKK